ncbi:MAG: hypothetical protein C0620_06110 [Desulfuromonas sp.]|nr:MAG: hypothetical protein C0620_06110 [Desulfuromonas sp.]
MSSPTVPAHRFLCGCGHSDHPLAAEHHALHDAGLADGIVLPIEGSLPASSPLRTKDSAAQDYEQRVFMARVSSATPGEIISAAIAVAYPHDPTLAAPVIPYAATGHKEDIEAIARTLAQQVLDERKIEIRSIHSLAVQIKVERAACALAGVVLEPTNTL